MIEDQALSCLVSVIWIQECICQPKLPSGFFKFIPVHTASIALGKVQGTDNWLWQSIMGQCLEGREVVVPEDRWDNNSLLVGSDQLGIHHDPRCSSVAISKGMNFADHEHHEHCAGEGNLQRTIDFKTLLKGSFNQFRGNEKGCPCLVIFFLKPS